MVSTLGSCSLGAGLDREQPYLGRAALSSEHSQRQAAGFPQIALRKHSLMRKGTGTGSTAGRQPLHSVQVTDLEHCERHR